MIVTEIFDSIDGEGIFAGELATFIRLAGCNLRCSYCDTQYSLYSRNGEFKYVEDILTEVKRIGNRHITLTGGEPLIHCGVKDLVHALTVNDFIVNIETNGSVDISPYQSKNTVITMDCKTPSSGEEDKMDLKNLEFLRKKDVLKIVCQESDFNFIFSLLSKNHINSYVFLSPIYGKIEPKKLVAFLKQLRDKGINTDKIRVQIQLHKVIWDPRKRGV